MVNRGAARRTVFRDAADHDAFLQLLAAQPLEIHAYALMGNHYHLLVRSIAGELSWAMRSVDGDYSKQHNRRYDKDGPLWKGRFHSTVIDAGAYFLAVSRYVHRNPVAAGMVHKPQDFPWSSYRAFIGMEPAPDWLHLEHTLETATGIAAYRTFVEGPGYDTVSRALDRRRPPTVIGDVSQPQPTA